MYDEPQTTTDSFRRHYAECARCQARFAEIAADAEAVAAVLSAPTPWVDSAAALAQVRSRTTADSAPRSSWRPRLAGLREPYGGRFVKPVAAMVTAVLLVGATALTPAGSLAQRFIDVFQPQQVVAVPVTSQDLRTLPDLSKYGTVHAPAKVNDQHVASAAQASSLSGMTVLTPGTLPSSVPSQVTYDVVPSTTGSFTFSAAKTRKALAAARTSVLTSRSRVRAMPRQINGSTLQVTVGQAVVATYGSAREMIPPLVIGQMKAPTVSSTGASVKQIEDYVLSLPGVSPRLAQSIKSIGDPVTSSTLPIPFPADMAHSQSVTVQGAQGVALGDNTGLGSAVIWEKAGIIYGVAAPLTQDQVIAIANSLH